MIASMCHYLIEGIVNAFIIFCLGQLQRRTLDMSLPDQRWLCYHCRYPSRGHHYGADPCWSRQEVERCGIYCINDGRSRRHGTAESWRRMGLDGRMVHPVVPSREVVRQAWYSCLLGSLTPRPTSINVWVRQEPEAKLWAYKYRVDTGLTCQR